jgi:hypothetical protein
MQDSYPCSTRTGDKGPYASDRAATENGFKQCFYGSKIKEVKTG